MSWKDLAPEICRQRMVVEGTLHNSFSPEDQKRYCEEISKVLDMTPVSEPKTDFAEKYGWCCFMHWKESGMHIYSWDHRNPKFFSIDIYTCKSFNSEDVLRYTEEFFGEDLIEVTWKN
tara:strand:+ start:16942 stop:17295 length:354 start_codon:yes stop_codon:yes gene_type:complete